MIAIRSCRILILLILATLIDETNCGDAVAVRAVVASGARSLSGNLIRTIPAMRIYNKSKLNRDVNEVATRLKRKSPGFYYGLSEEMIPKASVKKRQTTRSMEDAMDEMKYMKQEIERLREEVYAMKKSLGIDVDEGGEHSMNLLARRKRQREFDRMGLEVEKWAEKLLFEERGSAEHGWKEIQCNRMLRKVFNKDGRIKCYLKWMRDSRGKNAQFGEELFPCLKVYTTLDASIDDVCSYLADEKRMVEYNDLVVKHKDIEDVSEHSKIVWGQTPQILMISPRDFVTFCHHRWLRDGTQVIVNEAVDYDGVRTEPGSKSACRAYAIRGANFISPHPDDPEKTQFCLVAHADPGGKLPKMACAAAVNALAPIEPFKLFHKINENLKKAKPELEKVALVRSKKSNVHLSSGCSPRPGGLSQLGYACFWPEGGGLREGFIHASHPDHDSPDNEAHHTPKSDTSDNSD